ncbi:MAG: septum formation initiator family protein [Bacteroides sp.]|nr:septum formation initiator family protein [Roseburia sp.]MCM1345965.1 septum formation initiator family protein [Bacteroides sp.]MCM1420902.1 septum formation initiator family protein [Bacteroides sp.]
MKRIISFIFSYKYLLTFLIFAWLICFVGDNSLVNRYEQKMEILRLKNEIDEYNRIFENDKETLQRLKSDPEAIKEVARERYYMKTEDEDIYVVKDE